MCYASSHRYRANGDEMIRFLFRLVGIVIFAAAFVALVIDGARSIAASEITVTPLQPVVEALDPGVLIRAQTAAEGHSVSWIWDPAALWLLAQPTFAVLGVLALLLLVIGRKPRPPLGLKPV